MAVVTGRCCLAGSATSARPVLWNGRTNGTHDDFAATTFSVPCAFVLSLKITVAADSAGQVIRARDAAFVEDCFKEGT